MSRSVKRKEHPLSMRLPVADITIIDRAATLAVAHAPSLCAMRRYARPRTW
jgi:hypothetical protein